ncbi:MAG TPA: transporter substrate-binding domain-containing protein [Ilumatobacter sp.]|nr:transporter substrate-binding domain-containing protein [Ilumatobacter sp.]
MRARTSRFARAVAVVAVLGIVAAACGDDDETTDTTTAAATDTTEAAADTTAPAASGEFDLGGATVTVAVENAYLPFNYIDAATGEPAGWDYETIDAICVILNCVPEYQTFAWEPMIQAVADGQFDMAADGITITEERAEVVDFSDGYINIDQRLLVAVDSGFESVDDVLDSDCTVTSQTGTTNLATAQEVFGEDRVIALEEFGFVVQSVIAGDNCAAIIDETAGQGYVGANADAVKLVGDSLSSDQLGFIFPKGSELVAAFNYALGVMKEDGSLQEISSKYFGDSFTITYDDIADPTEAGDEGEAAEVVGVEMTIGYVLPQTGALSSIIDALALPVEMAVEEINAAGGNITLIASDSGTDPAVASVAVDGLINDGVSAIIGPAASGVTLSVIDKITSSGIVECSGSTTGSVFSTYNDGGFFFRTAPPDSLQGMVLADVMTDDGVTSAAIIYRNDAYGVGLDASLAAALEANGVTVAAEVAYDPDATSFDAEIAQVAGSGADAVVLITFGEGAALMQGMIEAGLGPDSITTYVTDGFKDEVSFDEVDASNPALFEGIRGTAPSVAPPDGDPSFQDRFAEYAPDAPTIFSGHFYDCTNVIALAAQAAGSSDPAVFVTEMQTVTNDGTECATWAACAALLAEGEDINYQGASGVVDLDENGEPTAGAYDVYTYDAESSPQTDEVVPISNS